MSERIGITQLEHSINRARAAQPASGSESALSPDVAMLADLYGRLIFRNETGVELGELKPDQRTVLLRWLPSTPP